MGDLTKNISRHELACKCGNKFGPCHAQTMDFETINVVQEACDHFAKKLGVKKVVLRINSAHRCYKYNTTPKKDGGVGSTPGSFHILANAIDHSIDGVSDKELFDYYDEKYPNKYGLSLYVSDGFVHLDTRPYKARW